MLRSRGVSWGTRWLLFAHFWVCHSYAANDALVVVLALSDGADRVALQTRAELEALNFVVVMVDEEPGAPAELEALAKSRKAAAAIRIVRRGTGAELWVADRVTGKTATRTVVLADEEEGKQADVLALRAVELLRASFLEIETRLPALGEASPSPALREVVQRDLRPSPPPEESALEPGVRLHLLPTLGYSLGGMPPVGVMAVGADVALGDRVAVGGRSFVPTLPMRICGVEGCASGSFAALGATAELALVSQHSRFVPRVGVLMGGAFIHWVGDAEPPHRSGRDRSLVALALVQTGVTWCASPWFRVRTDLALGTLFPEVALELARRPAAEFGRPLAFASLGVEVGLP